MKNKKNKEKQILVQKISILIGMLAGISTILTFGKNFYTSNNDNEKFVDQVDNNNQIQDNVNVNGDDNIIITGKINGDISINTDIHSTSNTFSKVNESIEETSEFNFGQAMQYIYNIEKDIKKGIINNEKNKPIYSSIYVGVSYWYISNQIRLIAVNNGFRENECSRTYYLDENEKLAFALIVDNKGEHRLYFYNDILIRYIDENGYNYDINQKLNNHECEWTELALEESYEILNGVKKLSE